MNASVELKTMSTAKTLVSHDKESEISNSESTNVTVDGINNKSLKIENKETLATTIASTPLSSPTTITEQMMELQIPETPRGRNEPQENNMEAVVAHHTNKVIARTKPALFQCFVSPEGPLVWQHMGIYDDEDLVEESL